MYFSDSKFTDEVQIMYDVKRYHLVSYHHWTHWQNHQAASIVDFEIFFSDEPFLGYGGIITLG